MRGVLLLGWALLAAFVAHALIHFGGAATQHVFATWVSDAIALSALAVCLWRAGVRRQERAVWGLAGAGIAAWGVGNAYWEHTLAAGASLPNPSLADLGYLGLYPLMYFAVIALRHRNGGGLSVRLWLDGLIGAAACATVSAALVLEPVIDATKGESLAGALTNIAYPIGDLTLLAMLVVTSATVGWRRARGLAALAAGMALFALADSLYIVQNANGSYRVGGALDAGWLVALMLMALGAARLPREHPHAGAPIEGHPVERALVPVGAALAALAVCAAQPFTEIGTTALACAIVTLALVITRLALSLRETAELLVARAREATLDPLTGLGNRRLLLGDLKARAAAASEERPVLLMLFDLDGFKVYNDTFGHDAGDRMLVEVAGGLSRGLGTRGRAYRIGGDEFCALLTLADDSPEILGEQLAAAMSRHGAGFAVSSSYGCALAPTDGRDTTALLRRADDEMYERKGRRRPGTESQVKDALIAALSARAPELGAQAADVAELAVALGRHLRLGATDLRALAHAAALHDIGKIAIPEEILGKPAPLDPDELRFVRTHPLIAQRIIAAAPALGYAAQIVRSARERWDGGGYPDGLRAEAVPLPARIVAICSAYQAMRNRRAHREALIREQALAELHRCSGTQFDPRLVQALIEVLANPLAHPAREPGVPVPDPRVTPPYVASGAPEPAFPSAHAREATGRRRLEAQLSYQADHDLLTGLLNRRRFAEELERLVRHASRYNRAGALLLLDVDNLKLVNDLHGHAAGDEALKLVAHEIQRRTRETDLVARLGGDELAIALPEAGEREALTVAHDIRAKLTESEIDPPVQLSVGVALFESPQELIADDLLTAADVALYEAKVAGRDQIRVYRGDAGAALRWVQRIRTALGEGRFVLYGQPIVELRSGRATHHELLLRMLAPDGDVIPPDSFIPTAERFGLINDIDRWVVREGLELARHGRRVSINLSAHSIGDTSILSAVRRAIGSGIRPGAVIFEITETAAMTNMQEARHFTETLAELGCDVALDDFGTGFGSFSYLKHLPTRYLKIDVEFVRELARNPTDRELVRAITDVGHSLGKRIIAEGVEDRATLLALRELGVDLAQGFHLGAPAPIAAASSREPAPHRS